jgi:hypothetical protein
MKSTVFATLLLVAVSSSAFAEETAKYYVVVDTVGNCSVIEGSVGTGKTAIGEQDGYASKDEAVKALEDLANDEDTCEGIIG